MASLDSGYLAFNLVGHERHPWHLLQLLFFKKEGGLHRSYIPICGWMNHSAASAAEWGHLLSKVLLIKRQGLIHALLTSTHQILFFLSSVKTLIGKNWFVENKRPSPSVIKHKIKSTLGKESFILMSFSSARGVLNISENIGDLLSHFDKSVIQTKFNILYLIGPCKLEKEIKQWKRRPEIYSNHIFPMINAAIIFLTFTRLTAEHLVTMQTRSKPPFCN